MCGNNEFTYDYIDLLGRGFDFNNVKMIDVGYGIDKNKKLVLSSRKIKKKIVIVSLDEETTINDKIYALSKAGAKGIILIYLYHVPLVCPKILHVI